MKWLLAAVLCGTGVLVVVAARAGRPGVPLGVSVPRAHRQDRAVVRGRRILALGVASATLAGIAALFLLGPETLAVSVAPLVQLAGVFLAMAVARRGVLEAKSREGWHDGVPVRLFAAVGRDHDARAPRAPYVVALVICLLTIMHGASIYDDLPQRLGTHFGFDGRPDAWGNKSFFTVFGPVLVGFGLTVVFAALAWGMSRMPMPGTPDGDRDAALRRAQTDRRGQQQILAATTLVMATSIGALTVCGWHDIVGWPDAAVMVIMLALPLVLVARHVLTMLRLTGDEYAAQVAHPSSSRQVAPGRFADSPDDDRYWKAGIFYVNRDDPRVMVPKRMGMGTTLNIGRPAGMAVLVGVVVLLVVTTLLPLVLDR